MAKRSGFDVTTGRQYLAGLPEFHPTKPLSEYKPATIKRYVTQFQAQQRAGVPISRQAARGHVVTPEHGPQGARPKLPRGTSAREYRGGALPKSKYVHKTQKLPRPKVHQRPINVPERQELAAGAVLYTTPNEADVVRHLHEAWDDRVVLSGFDCELGIYRHIGVNRGHSRGMTARGILEMWEEEGGARALSIEDWFIGIANSTDSDPEQTAERLGHVCLWQVYIYPRDPHLRGFNLRAPAFTR